MLAYSSVSQRQSVKYCSIYHAHEDIYRPWQPAIKACKCKRRSSKLKLKGEYLDFSSTIIGCLLPLIRQLPLLSDAACQNSEKCVWLDEFDFDRPLTSKGHPKYSDLSRLLLMRWMYVISNEDLKRDESCLRNKFFLYNLLNKEKRHTSI